MNRKIFLLLAFAMGAAAIACQPDEPGEEAADHLENAGEELEAAGEDAAEKLEDTCEEVKEKAGATDTDC